MSGIAPALLAIGVAGPAAQVTPAASQDQVLEAMAAYVDCNMRQDVQGATAVLDASPSDANYRRIVDRHFSRSWRCTMRPELRGFRTAGFLYRGWLARALYLHQDRGDGALPVPLAGSANGGETLAQETLAVMSRCVYARVPEHAVAYVRASPATPQAAAALNDLAPDIAACAPPGGVGLSREALLAGLSETIWQAWRAAR